ncbi:MAG: mobile mystery protein A [Dermatophilaceae bacterium]
MGTHQQARIALERRLAPWRALSAASSARPAGGWVRAIRDALGMSAAELATRMGTTQAAVTQFEASERAGGARLATLTRAANALGCDLVYAFVPRTPLEDQVRAQAERVLARDFTSVANSMRLEDQGITGEAARDTREELITKISTERGLWSVGN